MISTSFTLSDSACKRIAQLIAKRNDPKVVLRISVEGGGCSGFQYNYKFVSEDINPNDLYIELNGAKVVIDSVSLDFLKESILDYVEDLSGSYFKMKNPNAASGCGCGNSFSV